MVPSWDWSKRNLPGARLLGALGVGSRVFCVSFFVCLNMLVFGVFCLFFLEAFLYKKHFPSLGT